MAVNHGVPVNYDVSTDPGERPVNPKSVVLWADKVDGGIYVPDPTTSPPSWLQIQTKIQEARVINLDPAGSDANTGQYAFPLPPGVAATEGPIQTWGEGLRRVSNGWWQLGPAGATRLKLAAGTYPVPAGLAFLMPPDATIEPLAVEGPVTDLATGTVTAPVPDDWTFDVAPGAVGADDAFMGKTIRIDTGVPGLWFRRRIAQTVGDTVSLNNAITVADFPGGLAGLVGATWTIEEEGAILDYQGAATYVGNTQVGGQLSVCCFGVRHKVHDDGMFLLGGFVLCCTNCGFDLTGQVTGGFVLVRGSQIACTNPAGLFPGVVSPIEGTCGALYFATGAVTGAVIFDDQASLVGNVCLRNVAAFEVRPGCVNVVAENLQMLNCGPLTNDRSAMLILGQSGAPQRIRRDATWPFAGLVPGVLNAGDLGWTGVLDFQGGAETTPAIQLDMMSVMRAGSLGALTGAWGASLQVGMGSRVLTARAAGANTLTTVPGGPADFVVSYDGTPASGTWAGDIEAGTFALIQPADGSVVAGV